MRCQPIPASILIASSLALGILPDVAAAPKRHTSAHRAAKPAASPAQRQKARPSRHPKARSDAVFPADVEETPGYRYAQLDAASCYAEARKRQLPFGREEKIWPGITAPMRLTGPINGVVFRSDILEAERGTSPYELFDCRLALAVDDFSKLLFAAGISEVVFSSAYRPPPRLGSGGDEQGKRHAGGLAVDIHRLARENGSWIKIERDFHGRIGEKVCGKTVVPPSPTTTDATLLRHLACSAAEQHLFQLILTPNYDRAHQNHFHLGLAAGVRWFIVS